MPQKEFKIGDIVTLDRYNHIDDVERVKVTGYGQIPVSGTLTYKMDVKGITIESTGGSIMESKNYNPVPDEDRHEKKNGYWERREQARQYAQMDNQSMVGYDTHESY